MVSSFADYANAPELDTQLSNLNEVIERSVSLYDVVSDASIILNLSEEIPNILLDASSVDRVIINLIKNSCESIEAGKHIEINITTEYLKSDNKVRLSVQDDGVGFDEDVIEKVFEPYITTKDEGTGLGMAIVQNIIHEHGASIIANNVAPKGALIVIEFNCV
jgi:nitrogen fixation/metabolism regulation signal transduction histidine kinase